MSDKDPTADSGEAFLESGTWKFSEDSAIEAGSPLLAPDAEESGAPIFEAEAELPELPGITVLGEESRGGSGVVHSGWKSGGGRVRIFVARWPLPAELREAIAGQARRLAQAKHRAAPRLALAELGVERGLFALVDPGGLALTKVLARHGIPSFAWSAAVMRLVAEAAAELHDLNILHLDIVPARIQVDEVSGVPRLSSLGWFQARGPQLRALIRSDDSPDLGAVGALAPELIDPGAFGEVGRHTDVYALGATLYTLLAGTAPFSGGTAATVLRKVVSEDPTPLGRINPDVPEALEALCVACLKKSPRERPIDLRAVVAKLGEVSGAAAPGPVSLLTRVIQIIGEYRVVRIRERRGATVSYEVLAKGGIRPLALELGPVASGEEESSLQQQRELIQRIEDHPSVLKIHEVGLHEGRRYMVTDLVEGRSLEDYLAEGPLPVRRAVALARDIASALVFCHTYGVVHRGARPDLILVDDASKKALLTSIGRSPEVSGEGGGPTTLVSKGLLFSTLFYFSPEQIDASLGVIDGQTDIYVLGITLYEMLTGRRPFKGSGPRSLLANILTGEPRSPQALNHQVDADIASICLKCIAVERHKRYWTAREVQQDLQRWLDGLPVRARRRGAVASLLRWLGRRASINARRTLGMVQRFLRGGLRSAQRASAKRSP